MSERSKTASEIASEIIMATFNAKHSGGGFALNGNTDRRAKDLAKAFESIHAAVLGCQKKEQKD